MTTVYAVDYAAVDVNQGGPSGLEWRADLDAFITHLDWLLRQDWGVDVELIVGTVQVPLDKVAPGATAITDLRPSEIDAVTDHVAEVASLNLLGNRQRLVALTKNNNGETWRVQAALEGATRS